MYMDKINIRHERFWLAVYRLKRVFEVIVLLVCSSVRCVDVCCMVPYEGTALDML